MEIGLWGCGVRLARQAICDGEGVGWVGGWCRMGGFRLAMRAWGRCGMGGWVVGEAVEGGIEADEEIWQRW